MNLKRNIHFLLAAGIMACTLPARADRATSVIGVVSLTNYQAALLVITDSPPEASFLMTTHKWVTEGQGFDDVYLKDKAMHVEILQVDFTNGVVRAKENGVAAFYMPQTTNLVGTLAGYGLLLNNADFDDALDLYANLKGRTLLAHPDVKRPPLNLSAAATNMTEAVAFLKKILQERGATIQADGDKFEWIIPAGTTNIVSPAVLSTMLSPKGLPATNAVDALPAGSINFSAVELSQLLAVYQALTTQKWVQDAPPPSGVVNFHNQTSLSKAEALHAFDVLLAWHGFKVVSLDDKSFKLVPLAAEK